MDPLASPSSAAPAAAHRDGAVEESSYWAEGDTLVVKRGARLPDRCLLCNEQAARRIKRTLSWSPPWLMLLFVLMVALVKFGLLLFLLVAVCFTKRMRLELPLCKDHAKRYRTGVWLRRSGYALLVLLLVLAIQYADHKDVIDQRTAERSLLILVALVLFMLWFGSRLSKLVRVKRITATECRLTASPAFLEASPDHPWSAEV
ncbi:MAG: hypothetical protein H6831_04745 [Planctomycetes bacterium]|nr:hypothetical protein [Planctomycetota bacterium]MCB9903697.1 hypothetical protein [Planctomycetota bacterium]